MGWPESGVVSSFGWERPGPPNPAALRTPWIGLVLFDKAWLALSARVISAIGPDQVFWISRREPLRVATRGRRT